MVLNKLLNEKLPTKLKLKNGNVFIIFNFWTLYYTSTYESISFKGPYSNDSVLYISMI